MSSILKAGLPPPRPAPLPVRYATAAAAAVSTPTSTQATQASPSSQAPTPATATSSNQPLVSTAPSIPPSTTSGSGLSPEQASAVTSSPSLTHPSLTSPMLSSATSAALGDEAMYSAQDSPALSEAVPSSTGAAASSPLRVAARAGTFHDTAHIVTRGLIVWKAPSSSPVVTSQPAAVSRSGSKFLEGDSSSSFIL